MISVVLFFAEVYAMAVQFIDCLSGWDDFWLREEAASLGAGINMLWDR